MSKLLTIACALLPTLLSAQTVGGPYVQYYPPPRAAGATLVVAASNSARPAGADYVCTGTADQTCINAAIAALPANGGRVLLLEGTYTVTARIITHYGLWLQGQGWGTIIKVSSGSSGGFNIIEAKNDAAVGGATAGNYVTVSDLQIDGSSKNNIPPIYFWGYGATSIGGRVARCWIHDIGTSSYGVFTQAASDVDISSNLIGPSTDSCIEARITSRLTITGNTLSTCTGVQLYASTAGGITTSQVEIVGNSFVNANVIMTASGATARGVVVSGNTFTTNSATYAGKSLALHDVNGAVVSGNVWDSSTITAQPNNVLLIVSDATATNISLRNNTMLLGTASSGTICYGGILVAGGTNVDVVGNTISCPGTATATGISATAGTNVRIRENRITAVAGAGTSRVGISVAGTTGAAVEANELSTLDTGVSISATASASRVYDNSFASVTTPYSLLDTTALYRDQAGMAFTALPADVADGSLVYCSDCTIASPCDAGGTGALAKRLNNTYVCN